MCEFFRKRKTKNEKRNNFSLAISVMENKPAKRKADVQHRRTPFWGPKEKQHQMGHMGGHRHHGRANHFLERCGHNLWHTTQNPTAHHSRRGDASSRRPHAPGGTTTRYTSLISRIPFRSVPFHSVSQSVICFQ